jgi:hypothetical protein
MLHHATLDGALALTSDEGLGSGQGEPGALPTSRIVRCQSLHKQQMTAQVAAVSMIVVHKCAELVEVSRFRFRAILCQPVALGVHRLLCFELVGNLLLVVHRSWRRPLGGGLLAPPPAAPLRLALSTSD